MNDTATAQAPAQHQAQDTGFTGIQPAPAPAPSLSFPDPRPSDDAGFVTPKKGEFVGGQPVAEHTYVEVVPVAVRLSASAGGVGVADQVDVLWQVRPGQAAVPAQGGVGAPRLGSGFADFGGALVLHTMSLNGGAYEFSMKNLARAGFDAHAAARAYERDPEALGLVQALRASGDPADSTPARITQAMGMLALQRGDQAACGLQRPVRLTVKLDDFPKGSGKWRVRADYVNAIPLPTTGADVLKLVRSLPAPQAAGARPQRSPSGAAQTQAAAPAAQGPADDDVNF